MAKKKKPKEDEHKHLVEAATEEPKKEFTSEWIPEDQGPEEEAVDPMKDHLKFSKFKGENK